MTSDLWAPPPSSYDLPPDEVHIWRAALIPPTLHPQPSALNPPSTLNPPPSTLLSPDELARAERFHFDRDRQRYISGRAILRTILGRYLRVQPGEIALSYGPQGKPALAGPWAASGLSFNATHSHDLALYAVARERRIGIDLEHVREIPEARGIARSYFTADEAASIQSTAQPGFEFLRLWTRKEAVIKAVGVGLSMPLNCFDLSGVPGDGRVSFAVADPSAQGALWTLHELSPGAGYLGAAVIEGKVAQLQHFQLGFGIESDPPGPTCRTLPAKYI